MRGALLLFAWLLAAPAWSTKATDNGISVFFIHMQCAAFSSNTNTMPAFCDIALRYMRPCMREPMSLATSARMRCMPAVRSISGSRGCCACAGASSSQANIRNAMRMREKEKAGSRPAFR